MAHDRRDVLRAASVALLVPGLSALPRVALAADGPFAPPDEPMVYTRQVERSLVGGARFLVSRRFNVRFLAQRGGGFRVEGEQADVDVEAPAALAEFAELERQRLERSLFPLLLDHSGRIAASSEYVRPPQLELALAEVLARIEHLALPKPAEADARAFLSAVHARSEALVSHLPVDLFAPAGERISAVRTFDLPNGAKGQVSVTFVAEAEPRTGLMRTARREVVTELSGTRRSTVEHWTLLPQA